MVRSGFGSSACPKPGRLLHGGSSPVRPSDFWPFKGGSEELSEFFGKRSNTARRFLFRFVTRRDAPYTNNACERALRLSVVFHEVTGGFRAEWGRQGLCAAASLIATGRLHGLIPSALTVDWSEWAGTLGEAHGLALQKPVSHQGGWYNRIRSAMGRSGRRGCYANRYLRRSSSDARLAVAVLLASIFTRLIYLMFRNCPGLSAGSSHP